MERRYHICYFRTRRLDGTCTYSMIMKENKSWVLQAEEIVRIQMQSAQVAENYREKQESKKANQSLQQQEDIKK